jgi:hypothetical protein
VSKDYQFKLTLPAATVIEKAKAAAAKNGVAFKGDAAQGNFSGMGISGEYRIVESDLHVQIKQKPMLLTWGMIEKSLKEFFGSA